MATFRAAESAKREAAPITVDHFDHDRLAAAGESWLDRDVRSEFYRQRSALLEARGIDPADWRAANRAAPGLQDLARWMPVP